MHKRMIAIRCRAVLALRRAGGKCRWFWQDGPVPATAPQPLDRGRKNRARRARKNFFKFLGKKS
jgi:hypothetical protein